MVVYPSANAGRFTVSLVGMTPKEVTLKLLDAKGNLLEQRELIGALGSQNVRYDQDYLSAGFYTLVLSSDGSMLEYVKLTTVEI